MSRRVYLANVNAIGGNVRKIGKVEWKTERAIIAFLVAGVFGTFGIFALHSSPANAVDGSASLIGQTSIPDEIASFGASNYSSIFGGVVVTNNESALDVYLTTLSQQAEDAFNALAPAGSITFLQTPNTLAELNATMLTIKSAVPTLASQGVNIPSWYVDVQSGTIVVEIANSSDNPSSASLVKSDFGSMMVAIDQVSGSNIPTESGSRIADSEIPQEK